MQDVMPPVRYSRIATFEKTAMSSGVSFASNGNTCSFSQLCSGMSSAEERRNVMPEWVCASLKPGIRTFPPQSIS